MQPISSNTVFHVSDLDKSLDFYSNVLGFTVDFNYGEPPRYAGLSLGNVCLHLSSSYPYKDNRGHGNLYIICDEVDVFYQKLVDAGVEFYSPIGNQDYGLRDFAIKDLDENQIGFGAAIE